MKVPKNIQDELEEACKLVCQTFDIDFSNAIVTYNIRKGYFKIENIPDITNWNEKLFNITNVYVRSDKLKMKSKKESTIVINVLLVIESMVGTLKIPIGLLAYHSGSWSLERYVYEVNKERC